MKHKKLIASALLGGLSFIPMALAFAADMENASPATFAGSYTLWIAIIIGIIASFLAIYFSFQMSGSTVGRILQLIGFGMFVVVLGFLSVVLPWAPAGTQKIVHDLLFILGYSLMLAGVVRIKKLSV